MKKIKITCSDCKKTFIVEVKKDSIVDITLCPDCINKALDLTETESEDAE